MTPFEKMILLPVPTDYGWEDVGVVRIGENRDIAALAIGDFKRKCVVFCHGNGETAVSERYWFERLSVARESANRFFSVAKAGHCTFQNILGEKYVLLLKDFLLSGNSPRVYGSDMMENTMNVDVTMPPERPTADGRLHAGDEILGRYVVQAELGQGGMGVVYKCMDKVGGVEVAVKGLPPDVSHNADEMEEIRENFQLVCDLRHPAIVGVRTLERDEKGDYHLVMDVADGVNLNRWMKQHRDDDLDVKLGLLAEMADALDYAHSKRVMHRDMKPENVMVDGEGHVQILDFGLAARIRTSMSRVSMRSTSMSGTPGYKSPEQWRGQSQGAAADQYSLGVIAYKMLSEELPFDSDDLNILREAVLKEPVPEIPGIAPAVNRALARALAKTPDERFASCSDFVAVLGGGKATGKSAASTSRTMGVSLSRSTSARVVVAAVLAALALAGGGFVIYRSHVARLEQELLRRQAEAAELQKLRNAAIELKALAGTAHEDAVRRNFSGYPELAATLRSFNACYESGLEAFKNGDYAAATNFFERTGADMRAMAAEQRRLEAERRKEERKKSVAAKIARGYVRIVDDNGEEDAVWKPGMEHPNHRHWIASETEGKWTPRIGYEVSGGSSCEFGELFWRPKREYGGRRTSTREGVWEIKKICGKCKGEGSERFSGQCPDCNGTGSVGTESRCAACSGRGKIERENTCGQCSGRGKITEQCPDCGPVTCNGVQVSQHGQVCDNCNGNGQIVPSRGQSGQKGLAGFLGSLGNALQDAADQSRRIQMTGRASVPCGKCGGRGWFHHSTCNATGFLTKSCGACGGRGSVFVSRDCSECDGTGRVKSSRMCTKCRSGRIESSRSCSECEGTGYRWEAEQGDCDE